MTRGAPAAAVGLTLAMALAVSGVRLAAAGDAESQPDRATDPTAGNYATDTSDVQAGLELYRTACVSCHGVDGRGTERFPPIDRAGEATAWFYLHTGRMPLANDQGQAPRKERAFTEREIEQLVAYVKTLGPGPELPSVDVAGADEAAGGEVYRANCAACHAATGIGGALSRGNFAPSLDAATPLEVAAAVRVGPGQMPVFADDVITPEQLDGVAAYVRLLQRGQNPGGAPIGRSGPIAEGFVAWLVGMGSLLGVARWIGRRR
jgi:ubiquinol-cytochrome c reductase cytochrome c subunit